jgi:hypothetical protein
VQVREFAHSSSRRAIRRINVEQRRSLAIGIRKGDLIHAGLLPNEFTPDCEPKPQRPFEEILREIATEDADAIRLLRLDDCPKIFPIEFRAISIRCLMQFGSLLLATPRRWTVASYVLAGIGA